MDYTTLGKTGLSVSRLCLGMMSYGSMAWRDWILGEDDARSFVRQCIDNGLNFFDTADMYSLGVSEEVTGKVVLEYAPRAEVVIATKVFHPMNDKPNQAGLSRKHIMEGIDASLRRLGTDYVDLYQIHRWDYATPIEETMEALHDVVKAGKALYIGASSMYTWQFAKAQYTAKLHGWTPFVSMQNHYNMVYREEEREMIPFCIDQGIGVIPWSPLARGFLAGNRSADTNSDPTTRAKSDSYAHGMYYRTSDFEIVERVKALAAQHGVSAAQIALAWILHRPGVTSPIIGVTKQKHLDEALQAMQIKLSADEMRYLEALYQPRSIAGHS